jgi:hypothetical protein
MSQQKATQQSSWLDEEPYRSFIIEEVGKGETNSSIVGTIATRFFQVTSERSIGRFRERHRLSIPTQNSGGVTIKGDEAEIVGPQTPASSKPYPHLDDPDSMLRERGLNPEEWSILGATVNEWDGPQAGGSVITYHQAKLNLRRKRPELEILPARSDGWVAPPRVEPAYGSQLIVVAGDHQAPFHDKKLHGLFCSFLEENDPDRIVILGDTVDYPNISRHRLDPENVATVNECTQSGYDLLRDIRTSALHAEIDLLAGNHDQQRLRDILIDKAPQLYDIKRADTEETQDEKVLIFPYLVRLDELGINYVDPEGPYDLAQINLTPKLAVRHGWIARQGSGNSALATLEHLGYSVIIGHSHRQSLVYHTKHDIDGEPSTLTAAEAGCMCRINQTPIEGRKWPNYTVAPDWVNGFCTVTTHPNGYFRIDHATYVNGALLWRDEIYQ